MMNRLLLTLLLLLGTHTVAVADDFDDGKAAFQREDYATALTKLMKAAKAGDTRAQIGLGSMYENGKGVAQDSVQAVRWYTEAAESGDANGQYLLGYRYERGEGVPQDFKKAVHWYTKAADGGNADAQWNLGQLYEKGQGVAPDYAKAESLYAKAAKAGNESARLSLALMYKFGPGWAADGQYSIQAVRWLTKAAESGNAEAQFRLASIYAEGKGVAQDYLQAARWYTKAAEAGDTVAQFNLGVMYDNGQGVPKDYKKAIHWYRLAADQGEANAQFNLGVMYDNGRGVPKDYKKAIHWYRLAADQGKANAQLNLGVMYYNGQGVPQDYVQAHLWLNLAAAQGIENAPAVRDIVAKKMTPAQIAEAQKLSREWKPSTGTITDRRQEASGIQPTASGTGFLISRQGHVLTNNHVVDGCTTIRTTTEGRKQQLTVVGTDPGNDLALLKLPSPSLNIARFREGRNIRAGDGVVAVGFPLHGLLASEANITTGVVSALAGIGNDTRFLQITVPIQPGNSGGPLLDQGGNVVGIIVSKLDAIKIAKATGDLPQNINFAINGAVAKSFLDSSSVEYEMASSGKKLESSAVGEQARKFTLLLECFK